jgi:rare lipoprotein A (peptidoglycan hydrolase)
MVVSMLLAGPALAGTHAADTAANHPRKAPPQAIVQKKPAPAARSAAARTPARTPVRDQALAREQERVAFVEDTSVWNDSPAAGRGRSAWKQTGAASWYGGARWAGHMTASGVRYNENALTAAHAWLPIGTKVVVALNGSGRSVVVTINDRPGTHTRVIDLSREAARQLGIVGRGVAMVTLSPL